VKVFVWLRAERFVHSTASVCPCDAEGQSYSSAGPKGCVRCLTYGVSTELWSPSHLFFFSFFTHSVSKSRK